MLQPPIIPDDVSSGRTRWSVIRDAFRRGAVFKIGLAVLVLDFWLLGASASKQTATIPSVVINGLRGWHPRIFQAALVQEADGSRRAILSKSDEWEKYFPNYDLSSSPAHALIIPVEQSVGILAPWTHTYGVKWGYEAVPGAGYDSPAAERAFAVLVADAFDKDGWGPRWSAPLRSGVYQRTDHYPLGVAHDCVVLLAMACTLTSLVWWLPQRKEIKRQELIASGLCPGCRYSAGNLPRCPECGEAMQ